MPKAEAFTRFLKLRIPFCKKFGILAGKMETSANFWEKFEIVFIILISY